MSQMMSANDGDLSMDAYRELNARKMFWFDADPIRVVVRSAFAGTGINDKGWSLLWYQFDSSFNTSVMPRPKFYNFLICRPGGGNLADNRCSGIGLDSHGGPLPGFHPRGLDRSLLVQTDQPGEIISDQVRDGAFVRGVAGVRVYGGELSRAWEIPGVGSWEPRLFLAVPLVVLVFSFRHRVCTARIADAVIDTDMLRSAWGAEAGSYPSADQWAKKAAPFLLALGSKDTGKSLTVG